MIFAAATSPVPTIALNISLMLLLVIVAFAIVRMRSLFAIVMLQGVYSLVAALWFVSQDAVDVAFTEAAVGAGVSTVLIYSSYETAEVREALAPSSSTK